MRSPSLVVTSAIILTLVGGGIVRSALSAGDGTTSGDPPLSPYQSAIGRIAASIERLKPEYPQLAAFSCRAHCDTDRLVISYGYKTRPAPRRGGWTSGVPHPNEDGVWFYIDFHDPASQAQIHTQPVVPRYRYQDKRVMFLILEGESTRNVRGAILQILQDNGVKAADGR
jgi:hypothetical protein